MKRNKTWLAWDQNATKDLCVGTTRLANLQASFLFHRGSLTLQPNEFVERQKKKSVMKTYYGLKSPK